METDQGVIKSNSAAVLPTAPGLTFVVIKHYSAANGLPGYFGWVESNLTATGIFVCRPPGREVEGEKSEAAALALSQKDEEVLAMRATVQRVADQLSALQTTNERLQRCIAAAGSEGEGGHADHSAHRYVNIADQNKKN